MSAYILLRDSRHHLELLEIFYALDLHLEPRRECHYEALVIHVELLSLFDHPLHRVEVDHLRVTDVELVSEICYLDHLSLRVILVKESQQNQALVVVMAYVRVFVGDDLEAVSPALVQVQFLSVIVDLSVEPVLSPLSLIRIK